MNYQKIYDLLIVKRRLFPWNRSNGYCDYHHIIPICCDDENIPRIQKYNHSSTNLIGLTAKEHYVAHHLLMKIYENTQYNYVTTFAFDLTCKTSTVYITARHSVILKTSKKLHDLRSNMLIKLNLSRTGVPLTSSHKQKASITMSRLRWINNGLEHKRVTTDVDLLIDWKYGRLSHSLEWKAKLSSAQKGISKPCKRKFTEHDKEVLSKKQSQLNKGRRWITDGCQNKFTYVIELPDNWKYGYTRKSKQGII